MASSRIERDTFGVTAEGRTVDRYTLQNSNGAIARFITLGATLTELHVEDRHGQLADVALGFDHLQAYETNSPYFGSTIGRVAFRTTNAEFALDGKPYRLTRNAGAHHLHGGQRGLSQCVWQAEPFVNDSAPSVLFAYISPDGDQGYPGNLTVSVQFTLNNQNELCIDYLATTDEPTPVNLTHHSYFNLGGHDAGTILDHVLHIEAERYTPTDAALIPTGEMVTVANTPLDFRAATPIGSRLHETGGYDLSYVLSNGRRCAAVLLHPRTGRRMNVTTSSPALVLYTGNYLDGTLRGKKGALYPQYAGVCLETGYLPDSLHHAGFPSIMLRPGQCYREQCVYRFEANL